MSRYSAADANCDISPKIRSQFNPLSVKHRGPRIKSHPKGLLSAGPMERDVVVSNTSVPDAKQLDRTWLRGRGHRATPLPKLVEWLWLGPIAT